MIQPVSSSDSSTSPERGITKSVGGSPGISHHDVESIRVTLGDMIAECCHEEVQEALALNPQTPAKLVEKLAKSKSLRVLLALAANPLTPTSILDDLYLRANSSEFDTESGDNDSVHSRFGLTLHARLLSLLAMNPNSQQTQRQEVLKKGDVRLRAALAINPKLQRKMLDVLIRDVSPLVRREIAYRSDLRDLHFRHLVRDTDPMVLCALAQNPHLPMALRAKLNAHENQFVQHANRTYLSGVPISQRYNLESIGEDWRHLWLPNVPLTSELADKLYAGQQVMPSDQPFLSLRRATLRGEAFTIEDWVMLAENPATNFDFDLGDVTNLDKLQRIEGDWTTFEFVARHEDTPTEVVLSLINDDDAAVRVAVVQRLAPSMDDESFFKQVLGDQSAAVRAGLAASASDLMPDSFWTQLGLDRDQDVQQAVWSNPATPTTAKVAMKLNGFKAQGS